MNASANYLAVMPDCRGAADNEACKARADRGLTLAERLAPILAEQDANYQALRSKALTKARDAAIAALLTAQEELRAADRALASHQRMIEEGARK